MEMGNRMMSGRVENGGPPRDMMRSNSDLMGSRDMMSRDMIGGRDIMGGNQQPMNRDMMMGGNRDIMRSQSDIMRPGQDIMGSRTDMMGSRNDMSSRNDMMGSGREMMGSRNDMMDSSRDNNFSNRDMMGGQRDMMAQRSLSVSNGSFGGMNGPSGGMNGPSGGMNGPRGGMERSMSYHGPGMGGGSTSPPGPGGSGDGMKIGTWNEGRENNSNNANFPSVSHFEIGTFNINDPGSRSFASGGNFNNHMNGATQSNNGPIQPGMGIRETGIIEKLLHSYGFIQCCDRQARLFFHFSQFDGNIEHLKIGDPVEFEMTYDRRTGKPIASAVSKIAPEVVMSEERVIGTVTTEVKVSPDGSEQQGRISYENRGECFFLPFNIPDVEGNVTLASGDKVSFQMATVQRSGNLAAKTIRLENPAAPVKYQGVVNSLKDTFGFIERADVVKEIFFHLSEVIDGKEEDNSHPAWRRC